MDAAGVLEYFREREAAVVDAIGRLVDVESPSHDSDSSRMAADLIEEMAAGAGADMTAERIAVKDGEHLIIRAFERAGAGRTLMLGHTDTVHPKGSNGANPTRIENGRFYGCGIFDMKAGVVLMIEALRYFAASGTVPATPITIVLTCDEEVGSQTGRPIAEREAKGAVRCFVLEPSAGGCVKTGRKGTGVYRIEAHGSPAHAGLEPEKGANAVAALAGLVGEIHALAMPSAGTTVNVTTFSGGTATNVIPEFAACDIDVRFAAAVEAERVDAAIRSLSSPDESVKLNILGGINRPPLERTPEVAALFGHARGLAASFGYSLGETSVGGASDGNFIAAMGIPVLDGLGVAGNGAHTLDEYIEVADIAKRATLLTLLLADDGAAE